MSATVRSSCELSAQDTAHESETEPLLVDSGDAGTRDFSVERNGEMPSFKRLVPFLLLMNIQRALVTTSLRMYQWAVPCGLLEPKLRKGFECPFDSYPSFGSTPMTGIIGIISTMFLWGRLSDRYGRKPVLLLTIVGSLLSDTTFAVMVRVSTTTQLSHTLTIVGTIMKTITGGRWTEFAVTHAYVADLTGNVRRRAVCFSFLAAFFTLGGILGEIVQYKIYESFYASQLSATTFFVLFLISCVLCLSALLYIWIFLPESWSHQRRRVTSLGLLVQPNTLLLYTAYGLYTLTTNYGSIGFLEGRLALLSLLSSTELTVSGIVLVVLPSINLLIVIPVLLIISRYGMIPSHHLVFGIVVLLISFVIPVTSIKLLLAFLVPTFTVGFIPTLIAVLPPSGSAYGFLFGLQAILGKFSEPLLKVNAWYCAVIMLWSGAAAIAYFVMSGSRATEASVHSEGEETSALPMEIPEHGFQSDM